MKAKPETTTAMPGSVQRIVLPVVGTEYQVNGKVLVVTRSWVHPQAGPQVAWKIRTRETVEPLRAFQKRIGHNTKLRNAGPETQPETKPKTGVS